MELPASPVLHDDGSTIYAETYAFDTLSDPTLFEEPSTISFTTFLSPEFSASQAVGITQDDGYGNPLPSPFGAREFFTNIGSPSLFIGPVDHPTFVPGVYDATYFSQDYVYEGYVPGTITITSLAPPTSDVPEPGSFLLAGTGALALFAASRLRRTHAQ